MRPSVEELLEHWEAVYKKGLLTFWILLLLNEKPSYPYEMSQEIQAISQGTLRVDENSVYRAIARFESLGLVECHLSESKLGPPRKYYHLTKTGKELLRRFIRRNILVFEHPTVATLIQHAQGMEEDHESQSNYTTI